MKYTLADLEEARRRDTTDRANPRRVMREIYEINENVERIREALIEQGDIVPPPEEVERRRINAALDQLYPDARSKSVVEFEGAKYTRRYSPKRLSNSGKTVWEWRAWWEKVRPPRARKDVEPRTGE
jgi:hypothetical protein